MTKFFSKIFIFIFIFIFYLTEIKIYALSTYEIKKLCQRERNKKDCTEKLKIKKSNLIKGKRIKIQVLTFKK